MTSSLLKQYHKQSPYPAFVSCSSFVPVSVLLISCSLSLHVLWRGLHDISEVWLSNAVTVDHVAWLLQFSVYM